MEKETATSVIDKTMTITGEISFNGRARIDGVIEGNIEGEHLILSSSGSVKGDIQATSFTCHGSIEGNIIAQSLSARKGCTIIGTLKTSTLTVEPGATIQGQIEASAEGLPEEEVQEFLPDADDEEEEEAPFVDEQESE